MCGRKVVENVDFKTLTTRPQNEYLNPFENDLYKLIGKVEFMNTKNVFQKKLAEDIENIQSSKDMFVFVDKSTNLYQMSREKYRILLHDNITKTYQKTAVNTKGNIDKESKRFAKSMNLDDKMECYSHQNAFITLKDHKENFSNSTKCRLVNPSKSEVGLISKKYLSNIMSEVKEKTGVNQWRNTSTVIVDWFKSLVNRSKLKFIKFDIAQFYPSISEEVLDKAINYAKRYTNICDNVSTAIKLARKSLLFNEEIAWVKKGGKTFDVTMGRYDEMEICELVGLYLLDKLSKILDKADGALYRDDGLTTINNSNGPLMDKLKKKIIALFKEENFSITIDTNLEETDFLDVTFSLKTFCI